MGSCLNSKVVEAPIDQVWAVLRDFHDLSWAPNVFTEVQKIGDKGPAELGAQRKLNGAILETLVEIDDIERSLRHEIDDGPAPLDADSVTSYQGYVRAFPVTDTDRTFVLWTSQYETRDDGAVHQFCDPIYQAVLNDLARHFA